jgi:hypothetical protein
MLCSHCGNELVNPQARFCGHCRTPLAPSHPVNRVHPASGAKIGFGSRLWLAPAAAGVLTIVGLFVYFIDPGKSYYLRSKAFRNLAGPTASQRSNKY